MSGREPSYCVLSTGRLSRSEVLRMVWDLAEKRMGAHVPRSTILVTAESRGHSSEYVENCLALLWRDRVLGLWRPGEQPPPEGERFYSVPGDDQPSGNHLVMYLEIVLVAMVNPVLQLVWDLDGRGSRFVARSAILIASETRGMDPAMVSRVLDQLEKGEVLECRLER